MTIEVVFMGARYPVALGRLSVAVVAVLLSEWAALQTPKAPPP